MDYLGTQIPVTIKKKRGADHKIVTVLYKT